MRYGRYGAHEHRMARLAIDNALKDVIPLDANGHEQELRRQLANLSWTESPLLTQLLLGRAPVVRQNPHETIKGDLEAKFDVKVQATVVVVIDVPENIGAVSWMLKVGAQMCSMIPSMQSERSKEGLVVAEGALKAREAVFEDVFRARHVVVNIGLEGRLGHGSVHGTRLKVPPQDPLFVGVARRNGAHLL